MAGNMTEPCGLHEGMFEQTVRIEAAWPFPMAEPPEQLVEALARAMDRKDFPPALFPYFAALSDEQQAELEDGGWRGDEVLNEICGDMMCDGVIGWVGIAATPVFTRTSTGCASFSWGHYHTQLLFAPTGDQLIFDALEWSKVRHAEDTDEKVAA